jgi:acyl transferase domain-containing protein
MSGTNAHVILEEAPGGVEGAGVAQRRPELLAVTAQSEAALRAQAGRLAAHLAAHPEESLADVAQALATTRSHFPHRLAVSAAEAETGRRILEEVGAGKETLGAVHGVARAQPPRVAFLFTGQGSQYVQMGRQLYETEPVFRAALERCAAVLDGELSTPLVKVLYPGSGESPLNQTAFTQPALFALEYALAEQWRAWGVEPAVLLGHSVGEYAAACVAGVFSLEDGLRLLAARGRLMQALQQPGAMLSVQASEARVAAVVAGYAESVSIAAINGPEQVVISGDETQVLSLAQVLASQGLQTRRLAVSHAFHSPLMGPMLKDFARVAQGIAYTPPKLLLVSNLDGKFADASVASADYWVRHVSAPVRFAEGVAAVVAQGVEACVEIGPQPTLSALAAACRGVEDIKWLPSLHPPHEDGQRMRQSLGHLYVAGATVDWKGLFGTRAPRKVSLPTYAFQRERHWMQSAPLRPTGPQSPYALAGAAVSLPGNELHQRLSIGVRHQPYLCDHVVYGHIVPAGAFYVSAVLAVAFERLSPSQVTLKDVEFISALVLGPKDSADAAASGEAQMHIALRPDGGRYHFTVSTAPFASKGQAEEWTMRAQGWLEAHADAPALGGGLQQASASCVQPLSPELMVERMAALSVEWGPAWRWTRELRTDGRTVLALLAEPAAAAGLQSPLHPCAIDNCFGIGSATHAAANQDLLPRLPYAIASLRIYRSGEPRCGAKGARSSTALSAVIPKPATSCCGTPLVGSSLRSRASFSSARRATPSFSSPPSAPHRCIESRGSGCPQSTHVASRVGGRSSQPLPPKAKPCGLSFETKAPSRCRARSGTTPGFVRRAHWRDLSVSGPRTEIRRRKPHASPCWASSFCKRSRPCPPRRGLSGLRPPSSPVPHSGAWEGLLKASTPRCSCASSSWTKPSANRQRRLQSVANSAPRTASRRSFFARANGSGRGS